MTIACMVEGHGNSLCGPSALEFIRRVRLSSELELIQPGEVDTSRLATSRGGATVQGLRHIPGRRLVLEATKFAREGSRVCDGNLSLDNADNAAGLQLVRTARSKVELRARADIFPAMPDAEQNANSQHPLRTRARRHQIPGRSS